MMRANPFAWSFSALKSYEQCPKKHWHTRVKKDVTETFNDHANYGLEVHEALEQRLKKGTRMPLGMGHLETYAAQIEAAPGTLYTEQKLAMTQEFEPCGYFDEGVWVRGQIDATKLQHATGYAAVFDYKTGKRRDEFDQLAIMAGLLFAHEPDINTVRAAFIWLKERTVSAKQYTRAEMPAVWNDLLPRVRQFEGAFKTDSWPAKQNYLCKRYCPVKECVYHG